MKVFPILCLFIFLFLSCNTAQSLNDISAKEFQANLRMEYNGNNTPLKEDDKAVFKGLDFFPIEESYKVIAQFEKLKSEEIITMTTSQNLSKRYKKYGKISFSIQGKTQQLFVYQSYPINKQYEDHLFLPFKDETTGSTSYGAGRYIDLSIKNSKKGVLIIDFNKSYNPYCAYSRHYNCPLTPFENTLDVFIEAGIRYVHDDVIN